ncbi:MAG: Hpt domain-containing protein, partial [Casimicrobiaceae bacterium]
EFATALLLAESTIEHFGTISAELPQQVDAMLARVDAAQQNKPTPPVEAAPLLDEMARRAQERLLLAQVAREIQANLRHMEQVLDAFFRDNSKRADLATLASDSKQIAGALKMLGLDSAERLLELCQQQIDEYAKPDVPVQNDDLEMLAESLSGLGFYIEAVEQQRPDRERLITPLLDRRLGVAPSAPAAELETVEASVVDLRSALPETFAAYRSAPGDAAARDRLSADLTTLRHDAELIGDARLQQDADAALDQLAHAGTADTAALQDAVAALAGEAAAPAPAPSAETMRLLETDATQFDAELLDIYLTEAGEVLDTVATCAVELAAHPDDRAPLTVARRGFHTLKGSGRMVGLTDLGELAYGVEKIHNRLLEEDRPVTPAVIALIGVAESSFRRWVDALRLTGRVTPDAGALHGAIARVESEFPDGAPDTPGPAGPASPDRAPPPVLSLVPAGADAAPPPAAIEVLELDETPYAELDHAGGARASSAPAPASTLLFAASPASPQAASDAGAQAPPRADAEEEITFGGVTLSAALYRILCEEAKQHLTTLDAELQALQSDPAAIPSQLMVRASHTLCGIHRTGGFPLLATAAKALEVCLLGLQERGAPLPGTAQPVLARAVSGLAALSARVRAREPFRTGDEAEAAEIVNELETLRAESVPQRAIDDSESVAARVAEADEHAATPGGEQPITARADAGVGPAEHKAAPLSRAPVAAIGATTSLFAGAAPGPTPSEASLLEVHDDVDRQVLPIFLDEAAELFPQAGEQLRSWRAKPFSGDPMQALQRTLHTFKGSARMAGAMRLGEVAHLMESRLTAGEAAAPSPAYFDALDNDLDHIAFLLDRLQKGEMDAAPPWLAAPATDAPPERAAPVAGGAVVASPA